MSRAFVKEAEEIIEPLPDRPISSAPNLVTREGLAAIDAEIATLGKALAGVGDDRNERAQIARDLRYWTARRASAHVVDPPADNSIVRFGSTVILDRDDGKRLTYRIVGEDEADPERGTLSHVAPVARALMGKEAGDEISVAGHAMEIIEIRT
jgi:transcription elongation GreA/GreB family factor